MIRFDGKTALITGATGGIGREVTRLMGHAGAHLALCGKDSSRLSALQHELETLGHPHGPLRQGLGSGRCRGISAVAFLCSDLASYMTGETRHVSGGLHIV
ncbi:SDR family NAD(P)-dependent oxidoreductase [Castellaniella sp.]|uniref:SDR family NAD(P)-dependent oxidoreductase n=1 Tax=Castellaniella sp. TaxID=1955812 RepID=UPI00355DEA35